MKKLMEKFDVVDVQIGCGKCMRVTAHEQGGYGVATCLTCWSERDYGPHQAEGDRGGMYINDPKVGGMTLRSDRRDRA